MGAGSSAPAAPALEPSGVRGDGDVLPVMQFAYAQPIAETGYDTVGHCVLSDLDVDIARREMASLLYGEVLPEVRL
jgi:hypothetical protein